MIGSRVALVGRERGGDGDGVGEDLGDHLAGGDGVAIGLVASVAEVGYVEAAGPAEGLRLAAGYPGPIDLVISDVVMPGGDGRDLVERLGRMRPAIKALYISGHIEADIARGTLLSAAFLQKPFTMDVLVDKVRAVLDAAEVRIARV